MDIYGISESDTGELRYVGKTTRTLEYRLAQHLEPCRLVAVTHKNSWLKALQDRGARPVIQSIQTLYTPEDLNTAEIYWIKFFRDQGCRLTNATEGGEGNGSPSTETKVKMGAANLGKKHSPEHRAKNSAAHKGVKLSDSTKQKISAALKGRKRAW